MKFLFAPSPRRAASAAFCASLALACLSSPAVAQPSPSPLPIRGVTVDVHPGAQQGVPGASHVEAPPFAPRRFRALPAPSPSPSPSPRR